MWLDVGRYLGLESVERDGLLRLVLVFRTFGFGFRLPLNSCGVLTSFATFGLSFLLHYLCFYSACVALSTLMLYILFGFA